MSRYIILVILNLPLVGAAILNTVVAYKLHRTTIRRFWIRISLWLFITLGLVFAEPVYNFLFSNKLTQTEPLSLFDVIQITGITFTLLIANRALSKVDTLEHRVQDLHQELSIILSDINKDRS